MSAFYNFIKENLVLAMIELADENRSSLLNLSNFDMKKIPEPLFQLRELTKLYMNNNSLKELPEDICNLSFLKVLTLDYNLITSLPSNIGKLSELVCLNLSYNNLPNLIPEIGLLSRLEVLWLNHVQLESLPPEIGNCTFLDTLGARGNFLKELPPEIGNLRRLRWLTVEGNLLKNVPKEIDGLCSLIHLNLSNNQFEEIPKIDDLKNLQFVFLSQNFIKDIDLSLMKNLSFVKKIDLTDNPITNTRGYGHLKNLKLDSSFVLSRDSDSSESSSEDWEESAPTSDLDLSDSSIEEMPLDEILESALPQVAKFSASGI